MNGRRGREGGRDGGREGQREGRRDGGTKGWQDGGLDRYVQTERAGREGAGGGIDGGRERGTDEVIGAVQRTSLGDWTGGNITGSTSSKTARTDGHGFEQLRLVLLRQRHHRLRAPELQKHCLPAKSTAAHTLCGSGPTAKSGRPHSARQSIPATFTQAGARRGQRTVRTCFSALKYKARCAAWVLHRISWKATATATHHHKRHGSRTPFGAGPNVWAAFRASKGSPGARVGTLSGKPWKCTVSCQGNCGCRGASMSNTTPAGKCLAWGRGEQWRCALTPMHVGARRAVPCRAS